MVLLLIVTVLCAFGLYAALFMLRKTRRAARGELSEPSVVETPRARLFGPPNAALGVAYYPVLAALIWWGSAGHTPQALWIAVAAALLAAGTSMVLAYSLLFVTKMPCPYCWSAHAVNWLLLAGTLALVKISY